MKLLPTVALEDITEAGYIIYLIRFGLNHSRIAGTCIFLAHSELPRGCRLSPMAGQNRAWPKQIFHVYAWELEGWGRPLSCADNRDSLQLLGG